MAMNPAIQIARLVVYRFSAASGIFTGKAGEANDRLAILAHELRATTLNNKDRQKWRNSSWYDDSLKYCLMMR